MDFELIVPGELDPTPFLSYARARASAKAEQDPIVGDTVHFWDDETAQCMAATIVDVVGEVTGEQSECLAILDPDAEETRWRHAVPHSENKKRLSWHWPCGGQ